MNTKKFARFLKERSTKAIKEKTVSRYIEQLDVMVRKYDLDLEALTIDHLREVFDMMEEECAVSTINYRKMVLKLWLEFKDIEPDREMRRLLKSKSGESKRKIHPKDLLTLEELDDIVRHTKSASLRALWTCLYDTGCRPGALCNLNISDLILDRYGVVFHFRKAKTEQSRRPVRLLMPQAIRYFEQWLGVHPRRNDPDAPLFINYGGRRFRPVSLTIQLKKYHEKRLGRGQKKNKAPLNLYLFRKSRTTALLRESRANRPNSLNEMEIKLRLGHTKHSRMLERYYAITDESDQAEAELRYLGVVEEKEDTPQSVICPNCGAINETTSPSCHRCRLALTEEEVIRQQQTATEQSLRSIQESGVLQDLVDEAVETALRRSRKPKA